MNALFGPLAEKYCNLFLVFSAFGLVMFIVTLLLAIVLLMGKKANTFHLVSTSYTLVMFLVLYLQNRILYNMCAKTL